MSLQSRSKASDGVSVLTLKLIMTSKHLRNRFGEAKRCEYCDYALQVGDSIVRQSLSKNNGKRRYRYFHKRCFDIMSKQHEVTVK